MADLEIGPNVISVGGSAPSIPSQDPALAELSKSSQQVNQMAASLLYTAAKQKTDNETVGALIEYKNQLNKLDENVAGIKDFGKGIEIFKSGLSGISDNLRKNHPNLPDSAFKTIQFEMSNDLRSHVLRATIEQHQQAAKDLEDTIKEGVLAVKNSKSKREHDVIANSVLNLIDSSDMSEQHKKFLKGNFMMNVQREHIHELVRTHPDEILNMPPEKFGLPEKEITENRSAAYKQIIDPYNIALGQHAAQTNKNKEWLISHPEDADKFVQEHKVPLEYGESIKGGHIDEIPENPVLAAHINDELSSITNPKELQDTYVHKIIPLLHDMNPTTKAEVTASYREALNNSKNEFSNHAKDLDNDLRSLLGNRHSEFPIGGIVGKTLTNFNMNTARNITQDLKEAKTAEDQQKRHDYWEKKINEYYDNFMKGGKIEEKKPESTPTPGS